MKVEIKTVTPSMAAEFLSKNTSNRKVNKKHLELLIRSINDGKWRLNHQGVAFYEDGSLADGQHRLMAICETNSSIEMPVFTGIKKDVDTVLSIDSGRGRTITDSSAIAGNKITPKDSGLAMALEYGYEQAFPKLSASETYDLCTRYEQEIKWCGLLFDKHVRFISILPVKAACIKALSSGVPFGIVESFIHCLKTGEYKRPEMLNAVKVRSKLMEHNHNGGHERLSAYRFTLDAINKTKQGKQINRLFYKRNN